MKQIISFSPTSLYYYHQDTEINRKLQKEKKSHKSLFIKYTFSKALESFPNLRVEIKIGSQNWSMKVKLLLSPEPKGFLNVFWQAENSGILFVFTKTKIGLCYNVCKHNNNASHIETSKERAPICIISLVFWNTLSELQKELKIWSAIR